ncbi:MAG: hypothetical protein K8Q89_05590 [Nitrosarchaeum sp.]|nr:hypothetical protein [Nitrosarchaeum sp.]
MKIQKIMQTASEIGLRINKLDDLDEKTLQDIHQAIIEYKENRNDVHIIDYMW